MKKLSLGILVVAIWILISGVTTYAGSNADGSTASEKALRKTILENQSKFVVWDNIPVKVLTFKGCISIGTSPLPHGTCVVKGNYGNQQVGGGEGYFSLNVCLDDEGQMTFKAVEISFWD